MIYNNYNSFADYINKICEDVCEDLYIIIRSGYSMQDLLESSYSLEPMQFEGDEHAWLHDWYEGQTYIEVYDYYKETELLHKLQSLQHRKGLEDYID